MNSIQRTADFQEWFDAQKNEVAKARINARIAAAAAGNFGECAPVGGGVSEMKIDIGPGYRVYFTRIGKVVYLLLCGGNKSTQRRDIKKAITMAGYL